MKYQVYEFDFVFNKVIDEVLEPMSLKDARLIAELHANQWAGDEGVQTFEAEFDEVTTAFWGKQNKTSKLNGKTFCACSPESDFGCIVRPVAS